MGAESKGRAWFGKIYNKLETILVEVDTFTSQSTLCLKSSDPPRWESVRSEPKEVAEDSSSETSNVQKLHDRVDSPSCESPSDPPSHQNFDIAGSVRVEELVQGDNLKDDLSASSLPVEERISISPLLEKCCDANQTIDTSLGDEEPIFTDEESQNSTFPSLEEYSDASLSSATSLGDEETIITDEDSQISTSSLLEEYCDTNFPSATSLGDEESQISTSSLLEEYCDANLRSAINLTNKKPIITDEESQITDTLTPQKFSAGKSSVSSGEESVEEVRVESCREVVSIESQPTQSSLEIFGTAVECNDDPVLASFGISTDDSNLNLLTTKTPDVPVQDNVAKIRAYNEDNLDGIINGKYDVASLGTNALCGIEFREDPSYLDDSALYALRDRTKKLRSFKRKILDALTSKRRREKEYEQLAIWFGDADMASDLATKEDSKQVEAMDSKSAQVLELEDFHWEIL